MRGREAEPQHEWPTHPRSRVAGARPARRTMVRRSHRRRVCRRLARRDLRDSDGLAATPCLVEVVRRARQSCRHRRSVMSEVRPERGRPTSARDREVAEMDQGGEEPRNGHEIAGRVAFKSRLTESVCRPGDWNRQRRRGWLRSRRPALSNLRLPVVVGRRVVGVGRPVVEAVGSPLDPIAGGIKWSPSQVDLLPGVRCPDVCDSSGVACSGVLVVLLGLDETDSIGASGEVGPTKLDDVVVPEAQGADVVRSRWLAKHQVTTARAGYESLLSSHWRSVLTDRPWIASSGDMSMDRAARSSVTQNSRDALWACPTSTKASNARPNSSWAR